MTVLPEPGTVVVVLTAAAVLSSRQSRAMAGYVTVSFAVSMVELCGRKPAPRLRELQDLCYDNTKAQVAADAAEAHNRETMARVEADDATAHADRPRPAEAEIDGRREVQRIELQTEAGEKRLENARERAERAKAVIEARGGSVYYEPTYVVEGDPTVSYSLQSEDPGFTTKLDVNIGNAYIEWKSPVELDPDDTTEPT